MGNAQVSEAAESSGKRSTNSCWSMEIQRFTSPSVEKRPKEMRTTPVGRPSTRPLSSPQTFPE
eukprot:CAMPEP_0180511982 /NCGR_PEP_ID=MMETSP1036_2-20121128/51329_1 /TAXON_ID=632150 /ORGANISM="Azadinium spinosum, Strain 3D9" /LENGTH=62 /DNA_ID=CAMNT_0022523059 /DNA_START=147 /DNA_END=332 /DNA_ORIENTATION=+